jgi:hypothetical protein
MPPLEHWSEKLFEQDFTGQPLWLTPRSWFGAVRVVSSLAKGPMYQPTKSRGYLHLGPSLARALI